MDISSLMNPVGGNSRGAVASRKRSAEPSHHEPEPKRVRIELNGYELHPPEQQSQGPHGLYKVPEKIKIREIPRFAQRHGGGAKSRLPPRPPSHPSDFPDYNGPSPEKPRAPSSHSVNGLPPSRGALTSSRGSTTSPATAPRALPVAAAAATAAPLAGPVAATWEPNILDHIALDHVNRTVADWLFSSVIIAPHLGPTAAWEVEAKLGHLIDQNTGERLHMPALTGFVLDRARGPRVAFRSSMTESQHRAFNDFLNVALRHSLPSKEPATPLDKPRVPISYKHTRQVDTFYELPLAEAKQHLAPAVLALTNNSDRVRQPRVRVSHDQKTGAEMARIVKLRVSDLDIHNPTTLFDVRISVNVEVAYGGDIDDLERLAADHAKRRSPPRCKDRMTYNHQAYQIDLTQVTMTENGAPRDKEHELEVEINDMDEFRRQGERLREGKPSNYARMVNGFVDNVRLLQHQLPAMHP